MPVFGRILGIEGTAWNLSAAVFGIDLIALHSKPYRPPHGGIHPREAAQHHAS
ncbi:MAG: serine/threonine protein kinase, partial [Methanoregulaceae archaeon]|nr:serine/threonine protein kinase [Methanoregulaceae archaeon]